MHNITISLFLLIISISASANNLKISRAEVGSINSTELTATLRIDMSWENSWRDDSNWDAVWVFVKFRNTGGNWQHATLNLTGHDAPSGFVIDPSSDGKGVFIYRDSNGNGPNTVTNMGLQWNYGVDGLAAVDEIEFKVFGIEMAYVPEGSFYVGDGQSDAAQVYGNFELSTSGQPYQVTSENSFILGGGSMNSLGNNNKSNQFARNAGGAAFNCANDGCLDGSGDDFDDVISQTLPTAFPKGFNAFYVMKYEMTQQQFTDMLNTLTANQQNTYLTQTSTFFFQGSLQENRYDIVQSNGEYSTSNPNIPMIFFDWIKAAAYADWAALRPMTELEFEKASRGFEVPVVNEFAWGNANIDLADDFTTINLGLENENIESGFTSDGINGNAWIRTGSQTMMNVARAGIFAANAGSNGRVSSGSTIWGVMEMTGNAWERAVSVGHTEGRKFTGLHGDGNLSSNGYADVLNWPGTLSGSEVTTNIGVGYRGGGLAYPNPNLEHNGRVSSRRLASGYWNTVINDDGARFVRTAN